MGYNRVRGGCGARAVVHQCNHVFAAAVDSAAAWLRQTSRAIRERASKAWHSSLPGPKYPKRDVNKQDGVWWMEKAWLKGTFEGVGFPDIFSEPHVPAGRQRWLFSSLAEPAPAGFFLACSLH